MSNEEQILDELAILRGDVITLREDMAKVLTIVTEFHEVFTAMGSNPMLRQMFGGGLGIPAAGNGGHADKPPWLTKT